MKHFSLVVVLLCGLTGSAFAQAIPNLPTEPANPKGGDVWIWVENPVGEIGGSSVTVNFWAFRCGGTITAVKPSTFRTGPLTNYASHLPRPDIQAAMASKCSSIPQNIGYAVTIDFNGLARGPEVGYMVDVEVTDDLGRKTMLRQTRGSFTIR